MAWVNVSDRNAICAEAQHLSMRVRAQCFVGVPFSQCVHDKLGQDVIVQIATRDR